MSILQKAEALAAKIGSDIEHLWGEFEAFIEAKHAHKKTAEETAPATPLVASTGSDGVQTAVGTENTPASGNPAV